MAKWYRHEDFGRTALELAFREELAASNVLISPLAFTGTVGENQVLVEHFIPGHPLEQLMARKLISKARAIHHAAAVSEELTQKTKKPSTMKALTEEVHALVNPVINIATSRDPDILPFLEGVKQETIDRYSLQEDIATYALHGDFSLSNIILAEDTTWLCDFEFGKRSHFPFCDWYRLWHHSEGLHISELTQFPIPRLMADGMHTEESIRNTLALYDLLDYQIQTSVHPIHVHEQLAAKLLCTLHSRTRFGISGLSAPEAPFARKPSSMESFHLKGRYFIYAKSSAGYKKKYREMLVTHRAVLEERREEQRKLSLLEREVTALTSELRKIGAENDTLRLEKENFSRGASGAHTTHLQAQPLEVAHSRALADYSTRTPSRLDRLPKVLKLPLKAAKIAITKGPLHVVRVMNFRKMVRRKPLLVLDKEPLIEVVSLSFNSTRFIDSYFDAFTKVDYPKDKIVLNVIDNGSKDGSYELIKKRYLDNPDYPVQVRLTRSRKNLGFSGGNNKLFKRLLTSSSAHYYFLLNIDTEIGPQCFQPS